MRLRLTSFHSVILPLVGSRKSILHYSLSAVQNLSHDTVLATEEGHPLLQTLRMVLRKVVALGGMGEVERFKRRERKGSRRGRARKDLIRPAPAGRGRGGGGGRAGAGKARQRGGAARGQCAAAAFPVPASTNARKGTQSIQGPLR